MYIYPLRNLKITLFVAQDNLDESLGMKGLREIVFNGRFQRLVH
jgi:hypothetical protein